VATPADLRRWLGDRRLREDTAAVDEADLRRAVSLREALRALLLANATRVPRPPRRRLTV
jgi:hypothetical protein